MTSIVLNHKLIVTDQKVIVTGEDGRKVVYRDKVIKAPNETFCVTGSGEMRLDFLEGELNNLTDSIRLLMNFSKLLSEKQTKVETLDSDDKIDDEEYQKVLTQASHTVSSIYDFFSIKVREGAVLSPSIIIIMTHKNVFVLKDGIDRNQRERTSRFQTYHWHISKGQKGEIHSFENIDKTLRCFKHGDFKFMVEGSGRVDINTSLKLDPKKNLFRAIDFACYMDEYSSYRTPRPPHVYFKDLKPIKPFTKKEFNNLFKETK